MTVRKDMIVTGKTVEDARRKAAAQLGIAEEDMIVAVLEEGKKGFLGIGAVEAKISVSYEATEETEARTAAAAEKAAAKAAKVETAKAATARSASEKTASAANGAEAALQFINRIIADMELEGLTVAMQEGTNDDTLITVDGEGAGVLIGHHGETLDALQYLANLTANKRVDGEKRGFVRITVDVEGYRAKREAALRALARRTAAKVVKYKRSVMLEPMNPYERRIIHSEVQGIEGVSTNSIGSENNRRVVMFLEEEKSEKGSEE